MKARLVILVAMLLLCMRRHPASAQIQSGFSGFSVQSNNGQASATSTLLHLTTDGVGDTAASGFSSSQFLIQDFTASFHLTLLTSGTMADGVTFTVQTMGSSALGGIGGCLGYCGISPSVAVKFDTFQNSGDPSGSSTGVFTNGNGPIGGVDTLPSGVNLERNDPAGFDVTLQYHQSTGILTETLTDVTGGTSFSNAFSGLDIPFILGSGTAFIGFTGGTGGGTSTQEVTNFQFNGVPEPSSLALLVCTTVGGLAWLGLRCRKLR